MRLSTRAIQLIVLSLLLRSFQKCTLDPYLNNSQQELSTVKTRIKEYVFWGFRLILFLYVGCFLQNQRENVLKVFLKLFL